MSHVTLIFCANNKPQDIFLKIGTCFKFSHVGIVTPARTVIHATNPNVKEESLDSFLSRYPTCEARSYNVDDSESGFLWLKKQVGKRYDLGAIFGFIFQRDWQDDNKWFCSELAAEFLSRCRSPRFRPRDIRRVWPQTLYVVR